MSQHLEPRKITPADYWQAFKSANQLALRYPLQWLCVMVTFAAIMGYATENSVLLAFFPVMFAITFFVTFSVIEELETRSSATLNGIERNLLNMQKPMAWAIGGSALLSMVMILWGRDLALSVGVPQLVGLTAEQMPENAIFSDPSKGVATGCIVLLSLLITTGLGHKALIGLRYQISGYDALLAYVRAEDRNRPVMPLCEIMAMVIVFIPMITGLWWIGIYTIPTFAALLYFANKAIFDGTGKLEPKAPPALSTSTSIE